MFYSFSSLEGHKIEQIIGCLWKLHINYPHRYVLQDALALAFILNHSCSKNSRLINTFLSSSWQCQTVFFFNSEISFQQKLGQFASFYLLHSFRDKDFTFFTYNRIFSYLFTKHFSIILFIKGQCSRSATNYFPQILGGIVFFLYLLTITLILSSHWKNEIFLVANSICAP